MILNSSFRVKPYCIFLMSVGVLLCIGCSKKKSSQVKKENSAQHSSSSPVSHIFAKPAFAYAQNKNDKQVSLSDIAEHAVRSVVNIASTRTIHRRGPMHGNPFFDRFFNFPGVPQEQRARSLGSGVIINTEGVIITNNHVVQEAQEIVVTFFDGQSMEAKLVGTDPKSDVAVLRLKGKPKNIEPIPIGNSLKLRLGEVVLAIGNPFGVGQTVTMGIVSALGRANMGIVDYEDFIQTDAAINPGNSGGALVNMRGELVGINTAILSKSGGYQGIGFAIPTAMVKPISTSLIKHGRVIRGWLGVVIQDLSEEMAKVMKLSVSKGVLVADVQAGSPADKAGIKRGDVIIKLNGQTMSTVARLRNEIASAGANVKAKLTLLRDGNEKTVTVTLGVLPSDQVAKLDRSQGVLGGLTLSPLSEEDKHKLGLPRRVQGVLVKEVEHGSAADAAGLQVDDVILEINRQIATNPLQFSTIYKKATGKVLLLVYRMGSTMYVLLEK